jgi:hypothetical protein
VGQRGTDEAEASRDKHTLPGKYRLKHHEVLPFRTS